MATSILVDPLEEAEAIVEAEWLRLHGNGARSLQPVECDRPAPALVSARSEVPAQQQPPRCPSVAHGLRYPRRRRPATAVWPTQRSPPSTVGTRTCTRIREVVVSR